jgi:hypothetical protein
MVGDLSVADFGWKAERVEFVLLLPNPPFENKGQHLSGGPFDKTWILQEIAGQAFCSHLAPFRAGESRSSRRIGDGERTGIC